MSGRPQWLRPAAASAAIACGLAAQACIAPASNAASISSARPAAASIASARHGAAEAINCVAIANSPHNSSHVRGTVNFIGQVKCNAPVRSISMIVTLSVNGYRVNARSNYNRGAASLRNQIAGACRNGYWTGSVAARVIPPAGFSPPIESAYAAKTTRIAC